MTTWYCLNVRYGDPLIKSDPIFFMADSLKSAQRKALDSAKQISRNWKLLELADIESPFWSWLRLPEDKIWCKLQSRIITNTEIKNMLYRNKHGDTK